MGNGVILDTNCFAHVFNQTDARHCEFSLFLEWLCSGSGYLVYGGSKYREELVKAGRYLKVFRLLHQYNKARMYDTDLIDSEMERIIHSFADPKFNDPHLAAIVIVTQSGVICTGDARCIPFLKRRDVYGKRAKCPKFYTGDRCAHLLSSQYVGAGCGISKVESQTILNAIEAAVV